jgi:hypothetical protein
LTGNVEGLLWFDCQLSSGRSNKKGEIEAKRRTRRLGIAAHLHKLQKNDAASMVADNDFKCSRKKLWITE